MSYQAKFAKKRPGLLIKEASLALLDISVMLLTIAAVFFSYIYLKVSAADDLLVHNVAKTTTIYDRTGNHVLYEIHGEENRKPIAHEAIPDVMRIATVAAEDDSFYNHHGVDLFSTLRALKANIENSSAIQGGSTITQQLARNALLSNDKTLKRKVLEAILAVKIERRYTKEEILDMYLNEIPYGSNAYGVETAAEIFFGKHAEELTLDEAALLAALPKATTYYSPYGNHKEKLAERQGKILTRVEELNLANAADVKKAKETNTLEKIIPFKHPIKAPHFVFYVKEYLEKKYGKEIITKKGLKVYTTLDYELQKLAEQIISQEAEINLKKFNASNAALVAINPKNGQILAMVGSKDYFDQSIDGQVNVATRPRQPGSSFKPFAYAKAFEKGYEPETLFFDIQTNFGPDGSGKDYVPRNYDGKFHGLVSMRQALAMSLNIPAVKTLYLAGVDETVKLAHRLGITTLKEKGRYGLSLVLGGGEVTLLDETAAFAVFANDGKRNAPKAVLQVIGDQGNTHEKSSEENVEVLDEQIARKINSILSDNQARVPIFGSRNLLNVPGKTVAAKTGTTQEWRDGWTIGYTPSLAVGVWAGNNDNHPMKAGADGSYVAAPIWNKFMSKILENYPDEKFMGYENTGENIFSEKTEVKITYYDNKSGKKISEKKAKKKNPQRIRIKIETPPQYYLNKKILVGAEPPSLGDPMIERWEEALKNESANR